MNKRFALLILLCVATLSACKKSYTCECIGGTTFERTEKEIRATDSRKAKEECEANNQPPTTPDVINCGIK